MVHFLFTQILGSRLITLMYKRWWNSSDFKENILKEQTIILGEHGYLWKLHQLELLPKNSTLYYTPVFDSLNM